MLSALNTDVHPSQGHKASLIFVLLALALGLSHCTVTSLDYRQESPGRPTDYQSMLSHLRSSKGPIQFEQIVGADWAISRAGLINLDHPVAIEAGLEDGLEPIQIYFFAVHHTQAGLHIIDTGLGRVFQKSPESWPVSSMVRSQMNMESLKPGTITGDWLEKKDRELKGVLLTHMHLDHIMGSGDIPEEVPFYTGPEEASDRAFLNLFVQGTTDDILGNRDLVEIDFQGREPSPVAEELAVLDFFGDGSMYVLHVPGHTAGSLAFLINARDGLHLVAGDTCHTSWGWRNGVPPGSFTSDQEANERSLNQLKSLSSQLPVKVYPGHQKLH